MTHTPRFADSIGLGDEFMGVSKTAHLAVQAEIGRTSTALQGAREFVHLGNKDSLHLETEVWGRPRGNDWPVLQVFQLRGQSWTQVTADIRSVRGLSLGRHLSEELETVCVCIEVTDDAYYSQAVFDRGTTDEISLYAMNVDMKQILNDVDLEVPSEFLELHGEQFAGIDKYLRDDLDEVEYSYCRAGTPAHGAAELAQRLGIYLHPPYAPEGAVHGFHDLNSDDLVRMDVLWAR